MSVFQFGSGILIATPNAGVLAANPTPMQFGTLQEVNLEIGGETKELFGRNQFPEDVRRAKMKITAKAKFAKFNAKLVNDLFFGGTISVGSTKIDLDMPVTVPTTPFQISVTQLPNLANVVEGLGVRYSLTGKPLTKVAAAPAVGQYTYAAGVFTFNTGDSTVAMLVSYSYTDSANGFTTKVSNTLMGIQPKFAASFSQPTDGNQSNVKLYRCIATKFTRPSKNDDYTVPDFEFSAFADDAANVIDFYDPE